MIYTALIILFITNLVTIFLLGVTRASLKQCCRELFNTEYKLNTSETRGYHMRRDLIALQDLNKELNQPK